MLYTIATETFFFDAKTDYLAHFRKHMIKIAGEESVVDLLEKIAEKEPIFSYPREQTQLRINGVWIEGTLGIEEAVKRFGTEWKIEPVSSYRAVKDLIIDDSDFLEKHQLLAPYAGEEDFAYYQTLRNIYYASGSLPYNRDYFGDSMFVYAHYLIEKYPEKRSEILKAIDHEDGIWLYEAECNRYPMDDTNSKIASLLAQLPQKPVEGYTREKMAYYHKAEEALCKKFGVRRDDDSQLETVVDNITLPRLQEEIKYPFEDFKIAFYSGSFACDVVDEVEESAKALFMLLGAEIVPFSRARYADGFEIVDTNPEVAFRKAGDIVLDAFDSGADILVVDNMETHFMLDQNRLACEKAVGRDFRIPILNVAQITALAVGLIDKKEIGLQLHKVIPEFV